MDPASVILSNTYTKTDVLHRLAWLRQFFDEVDSMDQSGFQSEQLEQWLAKAEVDSSSATAMRDWGEEFFNKLIKPDPYRRLARLRTELLDRSPVYLTVPVELSSSTKATLASAVRRYFNEQVLLELKIDPRLSAGCRVSWRGREYDLTLGQRQKQTRPVLKQYLTDFFRRQTEGQASEG